MGRKMSRQAHNGSYWLSVARTLGNTFLKENSGFKGHLHGHQNGPWRGLRLVVVSRFGDHWAPYQGRHHGPLHGPFWARRTVLGPVLPNWQMTSQPATFRILSFDTYFEVRGITISPPLGTFVLECGSTHKIKRIWATNNSINLQNSTNMYNLTQHAKINSECNKLMQPSKSVLKHKTNIKISFKIMNAHAKLKMTLYMKFDHLGQELLILP